MHTDDSTHQNPLTAVATKAARTGDIVPLLRAARTAAAEAETTTDALLAPLLLALAVEADQLGRPVEAKIFSRMNARMCSPEAVRAAAECREH
ncbi:MAG: hypothetical protein ACRDZY_00565 [Acidimicrobiales bacterium]